MVLAAASASASLALAGGLDHLFHRGDIRGRGSGGEVAAAAGAGSKWPDCACGNGLNMAGLTATGPRRATLLGAGADAAAAGSGRLRGNGTCRTTRTGSMFDRMDCRLRLRGGGNFLGRGHGGLGAQHASRRKRQGEPGAVPFNRVHSNPCPAVAFGFSPSIRAATRHPPLGQYRR